MIHMQAAHAASVACGCSSCHAANPAVLVQDEFLGCMDKRMQAVLREAAAVAVHLADPERLATGEPQALHPSSRHTAGDGSQTGASY